MSIPASPGHLLDAVPFVVVREQQICAYSPALEQELSCDPAPIMGPLEAIGKRLDDVTFDELIAGTKSSRVRLGPALHDRPVRLKLLAVEHESAWLEVRSLADEYRLESLLRRSGLGHMLLSADVELKWSLSSNDLADVFPGDNPLNWVELMDPDDMRTLGKAIAAVGADPNLTQTVRHRLNADRTYTIIDRVESMAHDPDLNGVLVRSRLEDSAIVDASEGVAPYAGMTVSDHMPIGVVVASQSGVILHRNAAAAALIGAQAGASLLPSATDADDGESNEPDDFASGLSEPDAASFRIVFAAAAAGSPAHCTIRSTIVAGRWLRISVSPAAASTVVLTIEDTTELAEVEAALRASNRLLEALDDHSQDLVIVFDQGGSSKYVGSSVDRYLGRTTVIENEADVIDSVFVPDRPLVFDLMQSIKSEPGSSGSVEFRLDTGGEAGGRWHHVVLTNLLDDPDVGGIVLSMRDVHERHLVERELRFKATHDALTTLPDRAALQSRLEAVMSDAAKNSSRTGLIFCDIDNFKLINDRAGHRVGDLVLTEVATRLRSALRASDFVGRFGGDEFVVVAPNVIDDDDAITLAERIFASVVGPARCDDVDVDVSISMGVAVSDADCATAAGILHRADLAMYESKRRGRGRISLYTPALSSDDGEEGALRADLKLAIDRKELTLHYQPIVPLSDGLPEGVESLARWEHAEHGLISAQRFMSVAESSGMIGELGDELVRLACDDQAGMYDDPDRFVSINLSASQLGHRDAARLFLERMARQEADPSRVVVELTEGAFAQGPIVQANLDRFRAAGVRIFLDDFGIGYSSLSQLHRFPVDGIKIDASIISPEVDEDLVRLIVGVATTLDIRTVAEGVENDEQLEMVRSLGVDYAQGYLLGRPQRDPFQRSERSPGS